MSGETEKPDTEAASPIVALPPDGGLNAWIQVIGAHFLFFNSW